MLINSGLEAFSSDETSCRRGHRYVTIFIDLDREDRPVVFVTEGKGKQTVQRFREHLLDKGGHPDRVLGSSAICLAASWLPLRSTSPKPT